MLDWLDAFNIKMLALIVIYLFLPLSALTYYSFRARRHLYKVARIIKVLEVDRRVRRGYTEVYPGRHLLLAVVYSSTVCLVGLAALMFNGEVQDAFDKARKKESSVVKTVVSAPTTIVSAPDTAGSTPEIAGSAPENADQTKTGGSTPATDDNRVPTFPVDDSLLMLGMAFLGAYLWGIQYVFRRYMSDDLNPGVYYGLSMRMLMAGALAVVIFNAYEALAGGGGGSSGGIGKTMWPALAFVLGMFPQRGLSWLRDKVPIFAPEKDPTVRRLPLEMIEGIGVHDRLRLEEFGLDSCHDLATTDFVPMAISTPYSARTLIDWMLQAKLCIYCGDAMRDLRSQGIRTILDIEKMTPDEMSALAEETLVTKPALERAQKYLKRSHEVERLRRIGLKLGIFANAVADPLPDTDADADAETETQGNVLHAVSEESAAARSRPPIGGGPGAPAKP